MRKILLMTFAILTIAGAALAQVQAGSIGIFADVSGSVCNIPDAAPGLCEVYVVHTNAVSVDASEWALTDPACIMASFLADSSPFAVYIGLSPFLPNGKSVGYAMCIGGAPILVATLSYFCGGTTTACCFHEVVPHGIVGALQVSDCNSNLVPAAGGGARWNPDSGCMCNVLVHESTWGGIKEMFAR